MWKKKKEKRKEKKEKTKQKQTNYSFRDHFVNIDIQNKIQIKKNTCIQNNEFNKEIVSETVNSTVTLTNIFLMSFTLLAVRGDRLLVDADLYF